MARSKNITVGHITGSTGVVIGGGSVVVNGRAYDEDEDGNTGVVIEDDEED